MVDFRLTEEQVAIRKLAHDFAEKEIRPVAADYDEREEMPWEIIERAVELGLAGGELLTMEDESGVTAFLISEELHWGCAGIATAILANGLAVAAVYATGTPEQRQKWLPKCLSRPGNIKVGALALTEPGAGSDVSAIQTTALRDGDQYVLNGTKCFITNGGIADLHVVFATEDRSKGWAGLAAFAVEKDTPGISMGKKESKLGVRASHTAEVVLEDCRIPAENKLGGTSPSTGEKHGAIGALQTLEQTRPHVGIGAIGVARAAYEYALEYARNRTTFGKPIGKHQAIGFKLADMALEIDAGRLLCWRAGWMGRNNVPFWRGEGSMAKCYASDLAVRVTNEALQILGGHGYMKDHPVEKWLRDAKVYQIWEGTSEIQRLVISRAVLGI